MGQGLSVFATNSRVFFVVLTGACVSCNPLKEAKEAPASVKLAVILPQTLPDPLFLKQSLGKSDELCLIQEPSDISRCPFLLEGADGGSLAKLLQELQKTPAEAEGGAAPAGVAGAGEAPDSPARGAGPEPQPLQPGQALCFCLTFGPPAFLSVCPCDRETCHHPALSGAWREMNEAFSAAAHRRNYEGMEAAYAQAVETLKELLEAPERPEKVCIVPEMTPRRVGFPDPDEGCLCLTLDPPDLTTVRACSCSSYGGTKNFLFLQDLINEMNEEFFSAAKRKDDEGMTAAVQKAGQKLKEFLDREWVKKSQEGGG